MGIQGLLPLLKSVAQPVHISSYRGEKVAIDGFAWLHRGAHNCASELALNQPTDKHIKFCLSRIRLMIENGVKPVLVFDGRRLPMKSDTDAERSDRRRQERAIGMQLHESGQHQAAFKTFQRAVSITASAAKALHLACQIEYSNQVECLWAPFEADAQLAYLTKINYVKAVISEDSDLIVFGTSCVLYKMDAQGAGSEIKVSNLAACTELALSALTHEQFQQIAVLAGCDYLASLSGMGMKKAHGLIRVHKTWERALRKVKLEGKTVIPVGYDECFKRALLCFKHQTVFDPITNQQTSLNPIDEEVRAHFTDLDFLGPFLENDVAVQLAHGEISPETLEPYVKESLLLHRSQSFTIVQPVAAPVTRNQPVQRVASLPARASSTASLRANTRLDAYLITSSSAASKPFVAPRKRLTQDEYEPESSPPSRLTLKRSTDEHFDHDNKRARATNSDEEFSSFHYLAPVIPHSDPVVNHYLPPVIPHFDPVVNLGSATFKSVRHVEMQMNKENVDGEDLDELCSPKADTRPLSCNRREQRFTVERRVPSRDDKRAHSIIDRVFDALPGSNLFESLPATSVKSRYAPSIFDQFRHKTRSPSPTLPAVATNMNNSD